MSIQAVSAVLENSEFVNKQRLIQIVLANYADEYRACWPSIMRIEKEARIAQRSIQRHISLMSNNIELAYIQHGAKLFHRSHNKHRRNNLYFVLTGLERRKIIGIKTWAWQQHWTTLIEGENHANLTPFDTEPEFIESYYDVAISIAFEINKKAKSHPMKQWSVARFKESKYSMMVEKFRYQNIFDLDILLEPISNRFNNISYVTTGFLLSLGLIDESVLTPSDHAKIASKGAKYTSKGVIAMSPNP